MTLGYRGNEYVCDTAYYDDAIMSQAVENLRYAEDWKANNYNFFTHNCQDFVSGVLQDYYRLGGPSPVERDFPKFDIERYLLYMQSQPPATPPGLGFPP
jgi:hypothetical protein